jgi:Tol biopolymer transport system component
MLLCLVTVGNGVRPVSAQQAAATARQVWLTGDEDPCCTAPSADGRYIAYTDWSTGDLGVRDLVLGTSRALDKGRLGTAGSFAEPQKAMSADGRMIAYVWTSPEGAELRVIPTAGGTPRALYKGSEYLLPHDWAPGEKQLLVNRRLGDGSWQIAMISVADGMLRVIKSMGWARLAPQLSPDGRFIVYASGRNIFLLAADGSSETPLVDEGLANNASPYGRLTVGRFSS